MNEPAAPRRGPGAGLARRPGAGVPSSEQHLVAQVSALIESARESIASYANVTLTMTSWEIGSIIDSEVLGAGRAEYGVQILVTLSQELTGRFGRGFDEPNLNRMVKFSRLFPDREILVTLSQKLSGSHFLALLPLRSDDARAFYADEAVAGRWTVRELRHAISRKAYERREIADSQLGPGSMVPADTFSDPYLLDFLGLHDGYLEADLEAAILSPSRYCRCRCRCCSCSARLACCAAHSGSVAVL
ncbi:MAG: DUF1016 N-terminal domain-containing protein [Micropruina sp.]